MSEPAAWPWRRSLAAAARTGASLALFRGAQEALTNIARYAPGAATAITVSYQPSSTDPPAPVM
jgi:signal transduction histidine kinase